MIQDIKLEPILDSIRFEEMSDERYFSSEFSEYISNSKLSLINPSQGGSPEKYLAGIKQSVSDSLTLGSAVHQLVLQPEEFEIAEEVERPTAKMGAMADELFKIYKQSKLIRNIDIINASNKVGYYKDKMTDKRINDVLNQCQQYWKDRLLWESKECIKEPIYLDMKTREKLAQCLTSVEQCKAIQNLLHPEGFLTEPIILNEAALFIDIKASYKDKETILKIKGKLDNFTIDNGDIVLNDLKTTGHYIDQFKESFENYHYYRQIALYGWMLKLYAKAYHNIDKITSFTANMLLVSTIPTYKAGIYKVSKSTVNKGFTELIDLLKRVAALELL